MRNPVGLLAVLAAALCVFDARAAEVVVNSALPLEPRTVVLRASRIDRKSNPIERSIRVPGNNSIDLPEGVWQVAIADEELWAPRLYVRAADSVAIPVWKAGRIRGTAKSVTSLNVAFVPLDAGGPAGETVCDIDGDAWTCAIPAGQYDLRFSSPQFAPEYRFGLTVPGSRPLTLQFVAGASLSGRIEAVRNAKVALQDVEVALVPTGGSAQQRYVTTSDPKGFFQFKGLLPGEYAIRASRNGLATQQRSVSILAGKAAELNAPLLLDRPKRLTLTLVPPRDPDGQPWRVSLHAYGGRPRSLTTVSEAAATGEGEWTLSRVIAGEYSLQVRRSNGQLWKTEDVIVGDADVALPVTLTGERVIGRITLGDRPLAAKLSFGAERGSTLVSDSDGRFEGEIPLDDRATDERTVFVEADAAEVVRSVRAKLERSESGPRRVDIRLPATTLLGRVVHEDRTPAPNVIVTINRDGELHQVFSESDGSFQVAGLTPGEYRVLTDTAQGRSDAAAVRVIESTPAEVELVLRSHVVARGRVSIGDTPVIQASIYAIPRDTKWAPFMPQTMTTENGRFELRLPPRTSIYDLLVVHPAFDIALSRINGDNVARQVVATQVGGTLVVSSAAPKTLLLRHSGGECWLYWLAALAGAGGTVESSRIVIPRLEPGEYAVCSAKTSECGRGYLPPFGTLTLAVE